MTRKLKALILILVATIALSGCANDDGIYSDKGQVFRKILSSDLTSLDTSLITDEISSEVTAQTFEGLYTLGKGDKPVLGVAKAFPEKSKDGKTLKVKLRSDAKWSNGDKVTAQDFVYAWRKTVDPKTGSEFAYIMGDIKNASDISTGKKPVEQLGIKALDDETLQIELEKPVPYINQLLALNTFAPQNEKVAKKYGKNYGTAADRAVYNGPFKVDDWKQEDKKGYVDSVKNNGSIPSDTLTAKGIAKAPNGKDYASTMNSPLKYNPKEARAHWDKAKKELGKNELTFSMNTEDTPDAKISAEYIKSQVEKNLPGVTLKIKQLPFKQRVSLELSNNFEASLSGWSADYPDPMAYLETMTTGSAQNNTDWGNKEYDQLLKVARTELALQPNERYENLKKAEEMFLGDAPVAPIYQKGVAHLTNPQVKGLIYHKFGPNNSLKHVYIDKSIDKETGKKKK
ncbi:TPA: peptide ABC transporter substrate-binding protein [Staphylococcus aureus]|nr:peptide ABC transporter substrate-binding protein [Staphylococcus aureus]HEI5344387.1 peptide ABC transporter substrate-binding protein [Staphylococcus aureus]HEI5353481.1 peptide ABC transporter substrate-binding protein [Staphylococcus aureus]